MASARKGEREEREEEWRDGWTVWEVSNCRKGRSSPIRRDGMGCSRRGCGGTYPKLDCGRGPGTVISRQKMGLHVPTVKQPAALDTS